MDSLVRLRLRKLWWLLARAPVAARRARVAASLEHVHLRELCVQTVFDVGGNRGQFSLLALELFPGASVVAFEPIPDEARTLENVTGHRVRVHEVALGSEDTSADLVLTGQSDASSLLEPAELQRRRFGTTAVTRVPVRVARLDTLYANRVQYVARPALMKIDVQGTELDVLTGAGAVLDAIDFVYVEISFTELYEGQPLAHEVVAFLATCGFRLRGVYNVISGDDGVSLQCDALFERSAVTRVPFEEPDRT